MYCVSYVLLTNISMKTVDCDEEYYENNINCYQHVALNLDNIQTANEDSNNNVRLGMLTLILSISNVINSYLFQVHKQDSFECNEIFIILGYLYK